jgi:hypothetical protein
LRLEVHCVVLHIQSLQFRMHSNENAHWDKHFEHFFHFGQGSCNFKPNLNTTVSLLVPITTNYYTTKLKLCQTIKIPNRMSTFIYLSILQKKKRFFGRSSHIF